MRSLLVGLGGAVGSVLRFWASSATQNAVSTTAFGRFPLGTMVVNVVGCVIIGALTELAERRGYLSDEMRALLVIGFLGGFTTFSAFANDTVTAWRSGAGTIAALNIALSVALCLGGVVAGRSVIASLVR